MNFFSSKKKDETMKEEEQKTSGESMEVLEEKTNEEEIDTMPEIKIRKKYMYLALDENGVPVLDKDMQPIVSSITEEGSTVCWPSNANDYAKKIMCNEKYREEVEGLSPELREQKEQVRKAAKRKLREDAKGRLLASCSEVIEAAKRAKLGSDACDSSTETVTNNQQVVSEENATKEPVKKSPIMKNGDDRKKEEVINSKKSDTENEVKQNTVNMDKVCDQINQDICNAVDDILGTIAVNDRELSTEIRSFVQEQSRSCDARTKKYIEESISILGQKTQKVSEDVSKRVNDTGRSISESQDKIISKVNTVGKKMGDLVESVEGIEGNLTRLDQLDEIANLLRDKGLNISMEIPPVNAEEEDIINLVRYSQKITEQLGYAARELIRKSEAFKNQAESNENEQKVMAQRIDKARQEGVNEGRIQVVKQLISKYEDIDAIKDSTDNYVHVIWTMMRELGVEIDGEGFFEKGKEIELSDDEIEKMMATYSKFDGAGKYRVTRTGLVFHGEIMSVAQFAKIIEETNSENQESAEDLNIEPKAEKEQRVEEVVVSEESVDSAEQENSDNTTEEQASSEN